MAKKAYELTANVSTEHPQAIRQVLEDLIENGSVTPTEDGFQVKARMIGESARDLNRTLLSALRKVEKKTRFERSGHSGKALSGSLTMCPRECAKASDRLKRVRAS